MNFCDKFKIKNCMIINNWDYKKTKTKNKQNQTKKKKKLITTKSEIYRGVWIVFPSLITQKWWNPKLRSLFGFS